MAKKMDSIDIKLSWSKEIRVISICSPPDCRATGDESTNSKNIETTVDHFPTRRGRNFGATFILKLDPNGKKGREPLDGNLEDFKAFCYPKESKLMKEDGVIVKRYLDLRKKFIEEKSNKSNLLEELPKLNCLKRVEIQALIF